MKKTKSVKAEGLLAERIEGLVNADELLARVFSEASRPSRRTLWNWCATGKIPHVRVGQSIFFHLDKTRAWLDKKRPAPVKRRRTAPAQGEGRPPMNNIEMPPQTIEIVQKISSAIRAQLETEDRVIRGFLLIRADGATKSIIVEDVSRFERGSVIAEAKRFGAQHVLLIGEAWYLDDKDVTRETAKKYPTVREHPKRQS